MTPQPVPAGRQPRKLICRSAIAPSSAKQRGGTTLVEVLVSTILVGVVLYTSLSATAVLHSEQITTIMQSRVEAEAIRMLEEISGLAYEDPELGAGDERVLGCDAGETTTTRNKWDDVDDCQAYNVTNLRARDNRPITAGVGLACSIDVSWVVPVTLTDSPSDTGLKRVTVTVTATTGEQATVQGLFSRYQQVPEEWSAGYEVTVTDSANNKLRSFAAPRNRVVGVEDLTL